MQRARRHRRGVAKREAAAGHGVKMTLRKLFQLRTEVRGIREENLLMVTISHCEGTWRRGK
jgi:hypothetical protein